MVKLLTRPLLVVRIILYNFLLRFLRYAGPSGLYVRAVEPASAAGSVLPFGSSGKSLSHQLSEQRLYIFTINLYKVSTSRMR